MEKEHLARKWLKLWAKDLKVNSIEVYSADGKVQVPQKDSRKNPYKMNTPV